MNILDRMIAFVSPTWAYQRAVFRHGLRAAYGGMNPGRMGTIWGQSESLSGLPHLNLWAHRQLRDRARGLCENNAFADSLVEIACQNIIGNGFSLQMQSADEGWNRKAEDLMNAWFPVADFHGRTWVEHQYMMARCLLRDGDYGKMLLKKGQLALVEGDYVSSPYDKPTAFLHDGIELDDFSRVLNYYVMSYVDLKNRKWTAVKEKDFIFVANKKRATDQRGVTSFSTTFELHDQHKDIWESVVAAMDIAASILLAKLKSPTAKIQGLTASRGGAGEQGMKELKVKKGMINAMEIPEDIKQIDSKQPGGDFSPNIKLLMRLMALPFGLALEYALMDWSEVSGQTAKAVMLGCQRAFEKTQKLLIDRDLSRVTRWRISKYIKEGLLEPRADAFAHEWHAEPWPFLDRVKELQGAGLAIDLGLSTEDRENKARGQNGKKMRVERRRELEEKRAGGIPIVHMTLVQEIGVKAPASDQEHVGTPDPGGEPTNEELTPEELGEKRNAA
jgi:capsid protein